MTGIGAPREDGTVPYLPTVVASVDPDTGQRVYVYGWARSVVQEMNRDVERGSDMWFDRFDRPEYTTVVEWAGTFRTTHVYPTAGDWARSRELAQATQPEIELIDPMQLEGTT